jgi:hypothetical protein
MAQQGRQPNKRSIRMRVVLSADAMATQALEAMPRKHYAARGQV